MMSVRRWMTAIAVALCSAAALKPAFSQGILLDRPVRAANLTLFPSLNDTTAYYYVPDQAQLATSEGGLPEFSFLRYVSNTASGTDAEGGGIVHAVVTLAVPEREITRADAALKRIDPAGRIVGPVVYRSGQFGLVSSFKQENGDLTRQIVGLGRAPVLDGGRAAVSLRLTKLGAQILWESFQLPTPDISFTFEMEMAGYFSPVKGSVHADFDKLYNQQDFSAGVSADYLGAEIGFAFDKARDNGAIKVEIQGDDAQLEKLVYLAYDKIAAKMFEKQESQDAQKTLSSFSAAGRQTSSILDRATALLAESSKSRMERNKEIGASNQVAEDNNARLEAANTAKSEVDAIDTESDALRDSIVVWEASIANWKENSARHDGQKPRLMERAGVYRKQVEVLRARRDSITSAAGPNWADDPEAKGLVTGIDEDIVLNNKAADENELMAANAEKLQNEAAEGIEKLEAKIDDARKRLDQLQRSKPAVEQKAEKTAAAAPVSELPVQAQVATPGFAALAVYKMKKTRQTGTFNVNFSKYTTGTLSIRFDRNVGDLRSYFANNNLFRSVNLDDPLYVQRDVQVSIDGLNAEHFGDFVNFVSVLLEKKHQNGDVTTREVTVRRKDFNERGNDFHMIYGWNGDSNRDRWLQYRYKTVWSLFSDVNVEGPWVDWRASAINVSPPYVPKVVTLEAADAETLKERNVRAIRVTFEMTVEGTKREKKVTMVPSRGELSKDVELLLPVDDPAFEYSIEWVIRGASSITTGPRSTTDDLLFVDELPQN